jgi:hypothetical protein
MSDNPYAPPDSLPPAEPQQPPSLRGLPFFLLLVGFLGFAMAAEWWVDAYLIKEVIAAGGMPPPVVACFLLGSVALMAGIGRHWFLPWLGRFSFMAASAIMAVGVLLVTSESGFGRETQLLFALGLGDGLLGLWSVHRTSKIVLAHYSSKSDGAV